MAACGDANLRKAQGGGGEKERSREAAESVGGSTRAGKWPWNKGVLLVWGQEGRLQLMVTTAAQRDLQETLWGTQPKTSLYGEQGVNQEGPT